MYHELISLGRNFNNGEVIQLVLKSPTTGQWLPFRFVQMVMMHELAHNEQMNHSSAFHKVRMEFTNDMRELWAKGYTGDGLWGRGKLLENGAFARTELGEGEILPEHLCGGTFRSRSSKKRKFRPKITWKEQKERRIRKKFGTNGVALGADDMVKAKLEKGKKMTGKPRVAGSARGRELRAAAALARFESPKEEPQLKDEDLVTDSEAESDTDAEVAIKQEANDAVDIDGSWLLGPKRLPLVKVCENEDGDDENSKNELLELQNLNGKPQQSQTSNGSSKQQPVASKPPNLQTTRPTQPNTSSQTTNGISVASMRAEDVPTASEKGYVDSVGEKVATGKTEKHEVQHVIKPIPNLEGGSCPACSMENNSLALTCMACSNVLKPDFVPNLWRCKSSLCQGSEYINAGDVGICGVCATRKCSEGI